MDTPSSEYVGLLSGCLWVMLLTPLARAQEQSEISFASAEYAVIENESEARIAVARSGNLNSRVTVDYAVTAAAGAVEGEDFESATGTFVFEQGEAEASFLSEDESLFLSAVEHASFIAVDERGTEAAAATAAAIADSAPGTSPVFRADHPFCFLIRHEATGSILFLGRLARP